MAAELPDAHAKRLISVAEAARRLGISESDAYRLAAVGALPGQVKLPGKRMLVRARVLDAWLDGQEVPDPAPGPPAKARRWRA